MNREVDCPLTGPPLRRQEFHFEIYYIEWVRKSKVMAIEFSNQHLDMAAKQQNRDYDGGTINPASGYGDGTPTVKQKLHMGWTGPYLVLERITVPIQRSENERKIVVHVDNLKDDTLEIGQM